MISNASILHDRVHAAHLLGERLLAYRNTEAVVLGIPRGGVPVGYHLAEMLKLPFDIILCKKIKHPACASKSIGSVSIDEVSVSEECRDVPQDYVSHQISLIRHGLQAKQKFYKGNTLPVDIRNKTVILADDLLANPDTMLAAIKSIRKRMPAAVIVAVPVSTPEASLTIAHEADDFIFLLVESQGNPVGHGYESCPIVSEEEVRNLIQQSSEGVYSSK